MVLVVDLPPFSKLLQFARIVCLINCYLQEKNYSNFFLFIKLFGLLGIDDWFVVFSLFDHVPCMQIYS